MDSVVVSAARLLAAGDPLGALKRVALREDPPALALRGTAMAQLGDYERARKLLRNAARGFGAREPLAQARCRVAEAEVALAARDFTGPMHLLKAATDALVALGDDVNALQARLIGVRRLLLVGELDAAEQELARVNPLGVVKRSDRHLPAALQARAELTRAELAMRRVKFSEATTALDRAHAAAVASEIPALVAEVERARRTLSAPSARLVKAGIVRLVQLQEVEALFASADLIVDACRRMVRGRARTVPLAGRSVLFDLVRALAEAWPADVPRDDLIRRVFQARTSNESYRARLRVEISRLRAALGQTAQIKATPQGFALIATKATAVVVLTPPMSGPAGAILALLEDGESWSTSALACALGSSQRTVQRTLRELEEAAGVRTVGRGRSRRWLAQTLTGFATTLLLPAAPAGA